MKIGIVTWYWGNYGSELQAYALQRALENEGCEAIIIQHDLSDTSLQRAMVKTKYIGIGNTIKLYGRKLLGKLTQKNAEAQTARRSQAFNEFIARDLKLTSTCYCSTDYASSANEFDDLVCGSDQIWNPVSTAYHDFYWLGFCDNGRKFSYAPSMGAKPLSPSEKIIIESYLKGFRAISVREQKSADILNSLNGVTLHVETVLDPTLLLKVQEWREFAQSSQMEKMGEDDYLFAYLLRPTEEQCQHISSYASNKGLKIVTYPLLEQMRVSNELVSWGDEKIFADGPREFLARILNASCVVTDSFHCTLFSILFQKELFVFKKAYSDKTQFERIQNLLSVFELEDRVVNSTMLEMPAHTCRDIETKLSEVAYSSKQYLRNTINSFKAAAN